MSRVNSEWHQDRVDVRGVVLIQDVFVCLVEAVPRDDVDACLGKRRADQILVRGSVPGLQLVRLL